IEHRLRNNYRTINEEEYNLLKNRFKKLTAGYDKLSIKAQLIQSDEKLATATSIFDNRAYSKRLLEKLEVNNHYQHFFIHRYFRIAQVYKYFLLDEGIKSFLYLGNALPKSFHGDGFRKD